MIGAAIKASTSLHYALLRVKNKDYKTAATA